MWSPSAPLLRVGLSQQQVSIARVSLFGRVRTVEHLACPPDADTAPREPWRAAVQVLAQWLDAHKQQRFRLQLLLSGRWTRWQLVPWNAELTGPTERAAFAALRFRETYGTAAQHWQVLPASLAPGHAAPAAALDAALLAALQETCRTSGMPLHSLTPYFSSAFDKWRSHLKGAVVWFGTWEADTLTLGLLQDGRWMALQTQRTGADWFEALRALMAHMALACEVPQEGAKLYLAGDGPAPTSQPSMPFTWLSSKPLRTP